MKTHPSNNITDYVRTVLKKFGLPKFRGRKILNPNAYEVVLEERLGHHKKIQAELAIGWGVTQSRISQIESEAMRLVKRIGEYNGLKCPF